MKKMKRYPLLISMIVSAVIIVVSLFILGFFGMNLGSSLSGGSQLEVAISESANTEVYVQRIKEVVNKHGTDIDSAFVEDKFLPSEDGEGYTRSVLVVELKNSGISDETEQNIRAEISKVLKIDESQISQIDDIISSVKPESVLYLGVAIAVIAATLFVFGSIRYDIFAGLTFLIAILHNIILFISLLILTRVEMSLMSLCVALALTIIMSMVIINIFEKYREQIKLHLSDKLEVTERMISCEKTAVKPYLFVLISIAILVILLMFIPALSVRLSAVSIVISTLVSAYTSLIIAPAIYANLLEVRDVRRRAVLSRNSEVNKVIKKKIKSKEKAKSAS